MLVVDDDADIRYAVANILRKCGCDVCESDSVEDAIDQLQLSRYDVVFCDMRFHGGMGGKDLLDFTVQNCPELAVVLMSCAMEKQQQNDLIANGAAFCLRKPFFRDTCLSVLGELGKDSKQAA